MSKDSFGGDPSAVAREAAKLGGLPDLLAAMGEGVKRDINCGKDPMSRQIKNGIEGPLGYINDYVENLIKTLAERAAGLTAAAKIMNDTSSTAAQVAAALSSLGCGPEDPAGAGTGMSSAPDVDAPAGTPDTPGTTTTGTGRH